ncbi:MAG: BrnT family toxin [Termitinemataceae bacterium]|nr:MAG: BrnT family toxin [Termitinemataceae bacterium]
MFSNIFFRFEWDETKRLSNIEKHGVDFKVIKLLFGDKNRIEFVDNRKEYAEKRFQTIGAVDGIILFVVYTKRHFSRRIISARIANRKERSVYYVKNERNVR